MSKGRSLVDGYRAAAGAAGKEAELEPAVLEETLFELYARGRTEHPDIRVDPSLFGTHLADCKTPLGGRGDTLPAGDLFLACAALRGDTTAISRLRELSLAPIRSYLRRIDLPASSLDEIAQDLWDLLLAGGADQVPKLARYSGTGSLQSFIGITARRLALTRCRHENLLARTAARAANEVDALADDIELGFIKDQYRDAFRRAIEDALGRLDDRLRMVLRMRVVDNVTVDGIARSYGVAQASVSRWLAKAREQVVADTRRVLCDRLALSVGEFDSLWRLVASQLEISVSGILACNDLPRSGAA